MNHQEAKLILQAYHPDGQDASDPFFAGALEQVRRDPELQKWYAAEIGLEAYVQVRLQTAVPVPVGLKSNLLALRKIVQPAPWWRQPVKLAAAAGVIFLMGLAIFWLLPRSSAPLVSFRVAMARYSLQEHGHIAFESHDLAKIQNWLQSRNMETNFDLPAGLQSGPAQGCRVVDWNGRKATMICFVRDDGEHMDLFVMDRTGFPEVPADSGPQFAEADGLMTAVWAKGDKVYLLTGDDAKLLKKLLQST